MKMSRNYTPLIALLILILLMTACNADGSVSIDSLTGIQAQSSSPGSDKQIKVPNETVAGQTADDIAEFSSSNFDARSSSKLNADSPEDSDSSELHLYCEITAVTETTFTACDMTYEVDTTDDLTTMFTIGEFYEIEYILNENGTITIVKFELEDSSDDDLDDEDEELHLYCEITEVTEYTFTACGETYEVDTADDLTTLFITGEFYEIEYLLNEDGTITILKYEHEDDMGDDMDDDIDDDDEDDDDDSSDNYNDNNENDDNNNNNEDDDSENND